MSKHTKLIVATLAAMAMATPALAVTADISGFLQVRGIAFDNLDGRDETDDNARGVDQRLRLFSNVALNENVKAVFGIEVDSVWGDTARNSADKEVGAVGADPKGEIEIKHLYLDFNIPEISTNVKAGSQYFKLGGGLIIGEDAAGAAVRIACPVVKGNNIGLYWIKVVEGNEEDDDVDVDYYQVNYDLKLLDWSFTPYVGYLDGDDETAASISNSNTNFRTGGGETYQYYVGLDLAGKLGPVALAGTLLWNNGKLEGEGNDALGFIAKGAYKLFATTLTLEVARYGDDDTASGEMVHIRGYNNFSEILTGGFFDGRGTIGANATVVTGATEGPYYMNYQYAKLGVEQKINERTTVSGYYIYAEQAADTAKHDAITFGHEIDAYLDYTIVEGLVATLGGGYLLADDDFGATTGTKTDGNRGGSTEDAAFGGDDAWKAGFGLTYKF